MCTVFYSVNSHRKIVHLSHCSILHHISKKNRRSFESLEDAQAHGYRLCRCCPSIAQKYRKERLKSDEFCRSHGLILNLHNDAIHVISKHDCWRIIVSGNNKKLFLYHRNTEQRRGIGPHPGIVPGFHSQAFRSSSILGYLEYIVSHDLYRDEHPCTEKPVPSSKEKKELPDWFMDKYGTEDPYAYFQGYRRIRGTKKFRKEMARKKRQERRAAVIRVNALLDELAVTGY